MPTSRNINAGTVFVRLVCLLGLYSSAYMATKNQRTVTADHGVKCGPQFVDQTGVEVLNDRLFRSLMRLA